MSNPHIMIDIETLDNNPTAAVVSIGAVALLDGQIVSQFYRPIGLLNAIPYGSTDQDTMDWWAKQSEVARKEAFYPENPVTSRQACLDLAGWAAGLGVSKNQNWWSNGADFDLVVLKQTFKVHGLTMPWNFRGIRCYRTLRNLLPWVLADKSTPLVAHNALDDAVYQAKHLVLLLAAMPHPEVIEDK